MPGPAADPTPRAPKLLAGLAGLACCLLPAPITAGVVLWQNLGQAVEKTVNTHRSRLSDPPPSSAGTNVTTGCGTRCGPGPHLS
ncbi:hypothetical protein ACF1BU_34000 [Streptomyces sp. NPDC014724]|uniref:hypothetical protein n=1 Tax=unclassified Streptomyces TaxID=2593676 RepID=UPI0036FB128C